MKVTYPGLKKSFYKGYTELMGATSLELTVAI